MYRQKQNLRHDQRKTVSLEKSEWKQKVKKHKKEEKFDYRGRRSV